MAGAILGATGEKWEENLCLAEGLVKSLEESMKKLGGFSAKDLQSMQKRRVMAVLSATECINAPGHNTVMTQCEVPPTPACLYKG